MSVISFGPYKRQTATQRKAASPNSKSLPSHIDLNVPSFYKFVLWAKGSQSHFSPALPLWLFGTLHILTGERFIPCLTKQLYCVFIPTIGKRGNALLRGLRYRGIPWKDGPECLPQEPLNSSKSNHFYYFQDFFGKILNLNVKSEMQDIKISFGVFIKLMVDQKVCFTMYQK